VFIDKLRQYHLAAKRAHQEHNQPHLTMPTAEPAYAIAGSALFDGFGTNGNGSVTGADDVIDFGGNGNGSHGPLGAPTYDPPTFGEPDDPDNDHS
jgi:hypothetical protein